MLYVGTVPHLVDATDYRFLATTIDFSKQIGPGKRHTVQYCMCRIESLDQPLDTRRHVCKICLGHEKYTLLYVRYLTW
jgi:hypothetical protein